MNWKSTIIFIFFIFSGNLLVSQCEFSLLPDGRACSKALYLCGNELDGYSGQLPDGIYEPHPWTGICNYSGSAENVVWFAFTPCSSTVTLRISPSNCQNSAGIQAGLYRKCGPNFSVNCSQDSIPAIIGMLRPFLLTWNGFTPGQVAYLILDGMAGDICDFQIEVVEGIDVTPAQEVDESLLNEGYIVGQNQLDCQDSGDTVSYSMVLPTCIMNYVESCFLEKINIIDSVCFVWHVDNLGSGSYSFVDNINIGPNVKIVFNGSGADQFRINVDVNLHPYYGGGCAKGECGDVQDMIVSFRPDQVETTIIEICPNETLLLCGSQVSGDRIVECEDPTDPCKTLRFDVRNKPIRTNDVGKFYQCVGDYYEFQGVRYYNTGIYSIADPVECDLVHRFEVHTVVLNTTIENGIRQLDCNHESILLNALTISDFLSDVRYEWYLDNILIGNSKDILIDKAGRYMVRAYVDNNFVNCQSMDFVDITLNKTKPVCTFQSPVLNCRTKSGSISYGSNSPLTSETWTTPLGNTINGATFVIDSLIASSGVSCRFQATRIDNGCAIDTLVGIVSDFISPNVNISGEGELTCVVLSVPLEAKSNLTPEYVMWSKDGNFLVDDSDKYTATLAGNYNVFVRAARNGCSNENNKNIIEDRHYPNVELGDDAMWYCNTTNISMNPNVDRGSNFNYQWYQRNGGEIQGSLVNPDAVFIKPGKFYLQVGNKKNGCLKIDSINISVNQNVPEDILAETHDPLCFGQKNGSLRDLEIVGGFEPYSYTINGTQAFGNEISNLPAGSYEIEVKDKYECVYAKNFTLEDPDLLTIEPFDDITLSFTETSNIEVITNYDLGEIQSITWTNEKDEIVETGPVFFFDHLLTQTYDVEVVTLNGCTAKARIKVIVDNEVKLIISNVLKIGGNYGNDRILIKKNNIPIDILNISIYDRWGNKVFHQPPFSLQGAGTHEIDWNGHSGGQELQQGVYIMYLQYKDYFGTENIITTDVTVLK